MEMYESAEKTETSINQVNRYAWDYRFINEVMAFEREILHFSNCHKGFVYDEDCDLGGQHNGTLHLLKIIV